MLEKTKGQPTDSKTRFAGKKSKSKSFRIVLIYLIIGFLWIVLSDIFLDRYYQNMIFFSIIKGMLFIFVSAIVLYWMVYSDFKEIIETQDKMKKAKDELQKERDRAELYFEIARVISVVVDEELNVKRISREGCDLLGIEREEAVGENWVKRFIHEKYQTETKVLLEQIYKGIRKGSQEHKNLLCTMSGERLLSWRNVLLKDEKGAVDGLLLSGIDITEQNRVMEALYESERSKAVLISHIPGIAYRCNYDENWSMQFISDGCYMMTGYRAEEFIGNKKISFNDVICKEYRKVLWDQWEIALARRTEVKSEYEIMTASGERKWVMETGQGVFSENGELEALEGVIVDITESKERYEQIQYMNDHDFLTGLHNRRYFEEKKREMDREENLPISIILADINGVRLINDAFGHMAGDRLIYNTGEILAARCPEQGILARTGGDEFGILLPDTDREDVKQLMKRILLDCEEYNEKLDTQSKEGIINLSMGYGIRKAGGHSMDAAEQEAEENMYKRKLFYRESHHNAIITSVMATMYERSEETEEHAQRIAQLSVIIGEAMNLSQKSIDDLRLLAMLHDIGKIGIDDRILKKPGPLTKEEWDSMKKHPEIGYRITMSSKDLEPVAKYILHHHERWDGKGYPSGIGGKDIPLLSRILAVVDAYDAMTEDRVYRKAMNAREALVELKNNTGKQFDPEIVRLFSDLIEDGNAFAGV